MAMFSHEAGRQIVEGVCVNGLLFIMVCLSFAIKHLLGMLLNMAYRVDGLGCWSNYTGHG